MFNNFSFFLKRNINFQKLFFLKTGCVNTSRQKAGHVQNELLLIFVANINVDVRIFCTLVWNDFQTCQATKIVRINSA